MTRAAHRAGVTGAGSGIGLGTAIEAARLGFRSVAAVHRADPLGDVQAAAAEAGVATPVDAAVLDVTDDVAAADLVERVGPWAVVACAGFTNSGLIEDVTADGAPQLDVMLVAPARLVQLVLPGMRRRGGGAAGRRGGGRIVVVSSPLGEASLPLQATVKADWALRTAIRWRDASVGEAGTVHIADSVDELALHAAAISGSRIPTDPFVVLGQMTTADPTRSPEGTESAWAYTQVPFRVRDGAGSQPITAAEVQHVVERVEVRVVQHAPGFRDRVIARHVLSPTELKRRDANLVEGDNAGGTNQLHQQLVFRPLPGLARAETPIRRLYLASAHPGGGVHGACGTNAARAALAAHRLPRLVPSRTG